MNKKFWRKNTILKLRFRVKKLYFIFLFIHYAVFNDRRFYPNFHLLNRFASANDRRKNNVSYFKNTIRLICELAFIFWWWAWEDLNLRPHAYQACALTTWATSPCVCFKIGGDEETWTPDPLLARQVLSQLSYTPTFFCDILFSTALLPLFRSVTCKARAFTLKQMRLV